MRHGKYQKELRWIKFLILTRSMRTARQDFAVYTALPTKRGTVLQVLASSYPFRLMRASMSFHLLRGIGQPRVKQASEGLPSCCCRKDLWRFCGVRNRTDLQVCCKRLIDAWPQGVTIPAVAATWNRQQVVGQRIPPSPFSLCACLA